MFGIARYALKRLGRPELSIVAATDGLLSSLNELALRDTVNPLCFIPFFHSISRADLRFLAPYIDEWINGQAPPQNLPAEYPDERPEELRAFKERMQKEGLWPEKSVNP